MHVLKSHTGKITQGIFDHSGTKAYSCGFDSTLRTWDIELGICTDTIVCVTLSICSLAEDSRIDCSIPADDWPCTNGGQVAYTRKLD